MRFNVQPNMRKGSRLELNEVGTDRRQQNLHCTTQNLWWCKSWCLHSHDINQPHQTIFSCNPESFVQPNFCREVCNPNLLILNSKTSILLPISNSQKSKLLHGISQPVQRLGLHLGTLLLKGVLHHLGNADHRA